MSQLITHVLNQDNPLGVSVCAHLHCMYHYWDCFSESCSVVSNSLQPPTIQSMEFSRPECWSGQPCPSPGDLPNPGIKSRSPTLQADSLPAELAGKPRLVSTRCYFVPSPSVCQRQSSVKANVKFVLCLNGPLIYHQYWNKFTSSKQASQQNYLYLLCNQNTFVSRC